MNSKGFNLFTALVAIILILLTGLLINTMIQTESSTKNTLQNIANEEKINAVSETVRENVTQLVNFRIRWVINNYFMQSNKVTFELDTAIDYDLMRDEFIKSYFSTSFADEFANATEAYIANISYDIGDYKVYAEGFNEQKAKDALKKLMLYSMFEDGLTNPAPQIPRKEFLEPVGDCTLTSPLDSCNGTFYITLKAGDVPNEIYEDLPKVTIEESKSKNGIKVKNPILPRHDVKIFVPLRIFKILKIAQEYAKKMNTKSGTLQKYALGVCDIGMCGARSAVDQPAQPGSSDTLCPGDERSNASDGSSITAAIQYKPITLNDGIQYDPNQTESIKFALSGYLINKKLPGAINPVIPIGKIGTTDIDEMTVQPTFQVETTSQAFATLGQNVPEDITVSFSYQPYCATIETLSTTVEVTENNDYYKVIKGWPALTYGVTIKDYANYGFDKLGIAEQSWDCMSEASNAGGVPDVAEDASCSPAS